MDALAWGILGTLKKSRRQCREGTAADNIEIVSASKETLCIHQCIYSDFDGTSCVS